MLFTCQPLALARGWSSVVVCLHPHIIPFTCSRVNPACIGQLCSRLISVEPYKDVLDDRSSEESGSDAHALLTPKAVVEKLDQFIIGQQEAKRAVAVAFRNRWRRHKVPELLRDDIVPKNILMIGPTGCGKTEIARRLARLADSPFIKVEATKFTEVGYHGRDVEQIIRDLVENAVLLVRQKLKQQAAGQIAKAVEDRIVALLAGPGALQEQLDHFRQQYRANQVEDIFIQIEITPKLPSPPDIAFGNFRSSNVLNINLESLFPRPRGDKRRLKVCEARQLLEEGEAERMFPAELVVKEAIRATEQDGIVFIDEIDKVVSNNSFRIGVDPSSEGVQRDLLPIIEGSVVSTKHGNVSTDHILFICSGAFHACKPSDMMAELQGRLPIRVELKALSRQDLYNILTQPQYNIIRQQQMLLSTEDVELHFTEDAIQEIARLAEHINQQVENIGARRLHTVVERIVEEISFWAPERGAEARSAGLPAYAMVVDKQHVTERLAPLLKSEDLSRYIL